jgi:hypothetical protein
MHPKDFRVNEAWLAFRANSVPIRSPEGEFDVFVLMDAASMYIFGQALAVVGAEAPTGEDAAALLREDWQSKQEWPQRLILAGKASAENGFCRAAQWNGIPVVSVAAKELRVYISDVRSAFAEHFGGEENGAA